MTVTEFQSEEEVDRWVRSHKNGLGRLMLDLLVTERRLTPVGEAFARNWQAAHPLTHAGAGRTVPVETPVPAAPRRSIWEEMHEPPPAAAQPPRSSNLVPLLLGCLGIGVLLCVVGLTVY